MMSRRLSGCSEFISGSDKTFQNVNYLIEIISLKLFLKKSYRMEINLINTPISRQISSSTCYLRKYPLKLLASIFSI